MTEESPISRHTHLFHQMAEALGVDLEAELLSGRLTLEDLAEDILRCRTCEGASACTVWLETASAGAEDSPPGYCRNAVHLRLQKAIARVKGEDSPYARPQPDGHGSP